MAFVRANLELGLDEVVGVLLALLLDQRAEAAAPVAEEIPGGGPCDAVFLPDRAPVRTSDARVDPKRAAEPATDAVRQAVQHAVRLFRRARVC